MADNNMDWDFSVLASSDVFGTNLRTQFLVSSGKGRRIMLFHLYTRNYVKTLMRLEKNRTELWLKCFYSNYWNSSTLAASPTLNSSFPLPNNFKIRDYYNVCAYIYGRYGIPVESVLHSIC